PSDSAPAVLVSDDGRPLPARQAAVDHVPARAADGARRDADEQLTRTGDGLGKLGRAQRTSRLVQHHRAHETSLPRTATPTLPRVTTTDYEAVPAVERDAEAA